MREPIIAEFDSVDSVIAAAARLRSMGYVELEAYTPFPIPELEAILRTPRTKLPWLVLGAGLTGTTLSYLVLWWTNAVDYAIDVGGRPLLSVPAWIPIMFEITVLFAGGAAFLAPLVLSGLPRLHHSVFELDGFERTTIDRFWIRIADAGTAGDDVVHDELALLLSELGELGALAVRR